MSRACHSNLNIQCVQEKNYRKGSFYDIVCSIIIIIVIMVVIKIAVVSEVGRGRSIAPAFTAWGISYLIGKFQSIGVSRNLQTRDDIPLDREGGSPVFCRAIVIF